MEIDILTLFPGMFDALQHSIVGRARDQGSVVFRIWDIRDFAEDRHRTVDDTPFGGGGGMLMKPEPIISAYDHARGASPTSVAEVILLSPRGATFRHDTAVELSRQKRLVFICGHYEGVDERVRSLIVTKEISVGDFVLTGGELPAMIVADAVIRLLPGVLGDPDGASDDSFATGLLEYPQYTRPREFQGLSPPDVLLSGDHGQIQRWRRQESLRLTLRHRPDLLAKMALTDEDQAFLRSLRAQLYTDEPSGNA